MAITPESFRAALSKTFGRAVPHVQELGITVDEITEQWALAQLPYRDEWLGDSERGIIHTGVITTFVDSICGIALLGKAGAFEAIATLDLRMDYLRPAVRGKTLHCRAECYRFTSHIAFMRATVWQDSEAEPVAQSQSAFMRSSHSPRHAARVTT